MSKIISTVWDIQITLGLWSSKNPQDYDTNVDKQFMRCEA
jgi:hypothetical protein